MTDVQALIEQAAQFLAAGDESTAETQIRDALAALDDPAPDDVASFLNDWADRRFACGRYDAVTASHYTRALRLLEAFHEGGHPDIANVLNNSAALAQSRGDYDTCYEFAERARQMMEHILAEIDGGALDIGDHVQAAIRQIHRDSLTHSATALHSNGSYTEAEARYRQVHHLAEAEFGTESADVAAALTNIGVLCKYAGRFDDAVECYTRALAIIDALGLRDTATGSNLLYNLGGISHARGRFQEAEPFAREALAIARRIIGAQHPDYAVKLGALAAILDGQKRYPEAEAANQEALKVLVATVGPDHPDVALTLSNLGAVAEAQGRHDDAESLYLRALGLREARLGAAHPQVAIGLNNLATLLRDRGRYDESRACYERALRVFELVHGPRHPHTLACKEGYARLLERATGA